MKNGTRIAASPIAKPAQGWRGHERSGEEARDRDAVKNPKVMGSLGAKTKLPTVTSAAAPATIASLRQKARTLSPLRWASATTRQPEEERARHMCDKSRICGVNGSIGGASRKSARSQLRW